MIMKHMPTKASYEGYTFNVDHHAEPFTLWTKTMSFNLTKQVVL